jgi:hypothetical protein
MAAIHTWGCRKVWLTGIDYYYYGDARHDLCPCITNTATLADHDPCIMLKWHSLASEVDTIPTHACMQAQSKQHLPAEAARHTQHAAHTE